MGRALCGTRNRRGPHPRPPARAVRACGLPGSPQGLQWLSPSLSPRWPHQCRRLNLENLNRFRCKRGKGPGVLGGGTVGEPGSLTGSQGPSGLLSSLRLQPWRPESESWPGGADSCRRELSPGKGWELPGRCRFRDAPTMCPRLEIGEPATSHFSLPFQKKKKKE